MRTQVATSMPVWGKAGYEAERYRWPLWVGVPLPATAATLLEEDEGYSKEEPCKNIMPSSMPMEGAWILMNQKPGEFSTSPDVSRCCFGVSLVAVLPILAAEVVLRNW